MGNSGPLSAKSSEGCVSCEIVIVEEPWLVSLTANVEWLPSGTLPKARLEGLAVSDQLRTPDPQAGTVRETPERLLISNFPASGSEDVGHLKGGPVHCRCSL